LDIGIFQRDPEARKVIEGKDSAGVQVASTGSLLFGWKLLARDHHPYYHQR